jgi:hypothetical protein
VQTSRNFATPKGHAPSSTVASRLASSSLPSSAGAHPTGAHVAPQATQTNDASVSTPYSSTSLGVAQAGHGHGRSPQAHGPVQLVAVLNVVVAVVNNVDVWLEAEAVLVPVLVVARSTMSRPPHASDEASSTSAMRRMG